MNQTEKALSLAAEIGGKNGLNCIAELEIMRWEFKPMLEAYLENASASRKTLAEIVEYYESHPDTMMKYGDSYLRAALDETLGGLQGEPYLKALQIRKETIVRVTAEIGKYDAVLMAGPTSVMHFCGLPSVTVAAPVKTDAGVNQAVILYGTDECRLYEAALAIEQGMHERCIRDCIEFSTGSSCDSFAQISRQENVGIK